MSNSVRLCAEQETDQGSPTLSPWDKDPCYKARKTSGYLQSFGKKSSLTSTYAKWRRKSHTRRSVSQQDCSMSLAAGRKGESSTAAGQTKTPCTCWQASGKLGKPTPKKKSSRNQKQGKKDFLPQAHGAQQNTYPSGQGAFLALVRH